LAKKILIVDDEEDVLRVASFRVKKLGFEVIQAKDGQQCLKILEQELPDLILLDLRLPIIDGREVCKNLKHDARFKKIPVVIFTASTDKLDEKAKEMEADAFLTKPFDLEKLRSTIEKLLGAHDG